MEEYIRQSGKPVLLEVEPPLGEMEQRRIGFYERLGFHLNPYAYVQPLCVREMRIYRFKS